MSELEKQLKEELKRFNQINKYAKTMITEQDVPEDPNAAVPPPPAGDVPGEVPPPAGDAPMDASVPPPPEEELPMDAEIPAPDMEAGMDDSTEEIDITDLVNMTKSIKKDMETRQNDNSDVISRMDDVFTKLDDLESKLADMNSIIDRIDQLGSKIEQMKEPTPVEKLEMRSLDSYPFNKNPQQFFDEKKGEMERTGKNYQIKPEEATNYSNETIKKTFNPDQDENDFSSQY